jgi:MFS family permease
VGWLVDRIEALRVMLLGAITTGIGFLAASRSDTYYALLVANLIVATGVTAATLIPASLLIAGWFGERRGLAMGLTFAGTSLGGAAMIVIANKAIAFGGWRAGYLAMALPMVLIVAPLVLFVVRGRPSSGSVVGEPILKQPAPVVLPGVELSEAFSNPVVLVGYTASLAASSLSTIYLMSTFGKLSMGPSADRLSPRIVLSVVFGGAALGTLFLLGAKSGPMLAGFIVLVGIASGTPLVLLPLVFIQSLGLRRLGSVQGVAGIFATIGAAVGPVAAGRIFDVSGSYAIAFGIFAAMWLGAALAIYACIPLKQEIARLRLADGTEALA